VGSLLLSLQSAETTNSLVPLGYGWELLKMLLALAFVSILAYLLLRFGLRRVLKSSPGTGSLRVVDRCNLDSNKLVWIVEAAGRYFLVGGGDGGVSMLAELEKKSVEKGENFKELLADADDGRKGR
jgi:flagellar biosynthetic protein FliO